MRQEQVLFDSNIDRMDTEVAAYSEPHYVYLNRTARPEATRIRQVLERWFTRYPEPAREQLRRRFRSAEHHEHYSAFFELYVHELLTRLGHSVSIPQPAPNIATQRAPDFLVTSPDGDRFYVEATLATDRSRAEMGGEARLNQVYDALNRVNSPNFFIRVEVHGAPSVPVPGRKLCRAVEDFLAPLNPDECSVLIQAGGLDAVPCLHFELDGWRIDVSPIPKSQKARGEPGIRSLGMSDPAEAQWVDDSSALKQSVVAKALHYGDLELGLVVVVDAINQHLDRTDVMEALFGKESYSVPVVEGRSGKPEMRRSPNGAWLGPRGPTNTRISAVLAVSSVNPWSIAAYGPTVYYNPWAKYPLGSVLDALPHYRAQDDRMVGYIGKAPTELFGLPDGWPLEFVPDPT